jgi:hypothetical protein
MVSEVGSEADWWLGKKFSTNRPITQSKNQNKSNIKIKHQNKSGRTLKMRE